MDRLDPVGKCNSQLISKRLSLRLNITPPSQTQLECPVQPVKRPLTPFTRKAQVLFQITVEMEAMPFITPR